MDNPALIIIEVQKAFDHPRWGKRNNPEAERNIAALLQAWRRARRPIFHIQHMSTEPDSLLRPGQPENEIKEEARPLPGEPLLHKSVNSAFIGTDLEQRLRPLQISEVVTVGLITNHCVSILSRRSAAKDLRHSRGSMGLAELSGEFATIVTTAELLGKL